MAIIDATAPPRTYEVKRSENELFLFTLLIIRKKKSIAAITGMTC